MKLTCARWGTLLAAVALIGFSLAHSFEDFVYGVPARVGLSLPAAALLVAALYMMHAVALVFAARAHAWAYLANSLLGLLWLAGALSDHHRALAAAIPYREGAISRVLLLGVVITGLVLALLGYLAWRSRPRSTEIRGRQRPGAL